MTMTMTKTNAIYTIVNKRTGRVVYSSRNLASCEAMYRSLRPTFDYEIRERAA